MECKASGNPVPAVTWSKKVSEAGSDWGEETILHLLFLYLQNVYKKLTDGAVLTLDRIKVNDAGIYQCTAENGVGKPVSLDMKLDVLCKYIVPGE